MTDNSGLTPQLKPAPLYRVTDVPFDEFMNHPDSDGNIERTVQRLLASLDEPDGIISAFQSFASAD